MKHMSQFECNQERGFTLVEILMVLLLVGILAAVAIPQFVDFQSDARNSATQSNLAALRTGILNQRAQANLRCGTTGWPPIADINANNINNSACAVPVSDNKFVASENLPNNPWGTTNVVLSCVAGAGCTRGNDSTGCLGAAAYSGGWCYNPTTGEIWADSQLNGQPAATSEESY